MSARTTTGESPGRRGTAPPERVLGHRVGPAADVFTLGAVLVQAASGDDVIDLVIDLAEDHRPCVFPSSGTPIGSGRPPTPTGSPSWTVTP
ncbi:hypothetical protein [Streptomyces atroolivaceus]|uniref:hypothetical protein n=1 Tax=Streptomyces atroolivaceus TaxID=66869 RepID=UPI003643EBE5